MPIGRASGIVKVTKQTEWCREKIYGSSEDLPRLFGYLAPGRSAMRQQGLPSVLHQDKAEGKAEHGTIGRGASHERAGRTSGTAGRSRMVNMGGFECMSMSIGSGAWNWRLHVGLFGIAFRGPLERGLWDMGTARWQINLH